MEEIKKALIELAAHVEKVTEPNSIGLRQRIEHVINGGE